MGIPQYDSPLRYPLAPEDTLQMTPERREYMVKLNDLARDGRIGPSTQTAAIVVLCRTISMEALRETFEIIEVTPLSSGGESTLQVRSEYAS